MGWEGKRPPMFQSRLMGLLQAALAVYVFVMSNNKQTNKKPQKLIYWVSRSGPFAPLLHRLPFTSKAFSYKKKQKKLFLQTFPAKC